MQGHTVRRVCLVGIVDKSPKNKNTADLLLEGMPCLALFVQNLSGSARVFVSAGVRMSVDEDVAADADILELLAIFRHGAHRAHQVRARDRGQRGRP
jgi:hypothetical protein